MREASRAASKERQLLLYQQQEIQRLRQSAAQVRDKLKKDVTADDLSLSEVNTEDEISIGVSIAFHCLFCLFTTVVKSQ
jgi:hypothetical protein